MQYYEKQKINDEFRLLFYVKAGGFSGWIEPV